jgi:hypothetical protein
MDGIGPWIDPPPLNKPPYYDPPPFRGPETYNARSPEAWFGGSVVAHEYGHLVHYWQWDGFGKWTSFCYDGNCDEGGDPEYVLAAFKEGWAEFIEKVVWDGLGNGFGTGCDNIETRSPIGSPYLTPPAIPTLATIGRRWIPDVEEALCDLWDANQDSAHYGLATYDDTANTSLVSLVAHLAFVWGSIDQADIKNADTFGPNDTATTPFGICEFVDRRANNASWIEALKVSGIDCGL